MKRAQLIAVSITVVLVFVLFFVTKGTFFGERKAKTTGSAPVSSHEIYSSDSVLFYSRQFLSPEHSERLNRLENSISRGDVSNQKLQLYHQLAHFWKDSARIFPPYAHYTAEAARLENSEKSLTFAAHLFLERLQEEPEPRLKQWEAAQAKDLFERSLKLNPENDSTHIGLGAVYLYGGVGPPMEGIQMVRNVAEKNPGNVYAQMTLGKASLISGQVDKAVERFKAVIQLEPENVEAILLLADTYERTHDHDAAVNMYERSLKLVPNPEFKKEVEKRIYQLKNEPH